MLRHLIRIPLAAGALLALTAPAAAAAGTCAEEAQKEARSDGGYVIVTGCSGGSGAPVVTGSVPANACAASASDATRLLYRPAGYVGTDGSCTWTYDGSTFVQTFDARAGGNNPPVCAAVPPLALGADERATSSVSCTDRDFDANLVTDSVAITAGDPPLGRIEDLAVQADKSVRFTYVLDGPTTETQDTIPFTATDSYTTPKTTSLSVLVQFGANEAPACAPASAKTTSGTPVTITVSCSDPDPGDAIAVKVLAAPTGGAVTQNGGEFTYTSRSGFSGADTFTVQASDGRRTASATVTVNVVSADADGDGSPAGVDCDDNDPFRAPGRLEILGNTRDEDCDGRAQTFVRLAALITPKWLTAAGVTRVRRLTIRAIPKGAVVEVRCRGRGCPYKRKRLAPRTATLDLTKSLRRARLRPRAVLEIRITLKDRIGKVVRYTVRSKGKPKVTTLCLAPGATTPKTCG